MLPAIRHGSMLLSRFICKHSVLDDVAHIVVVIGEFVEYSEFILKLSWVMVAHRVCGL